jgi:thiol:disulfide interchange protein
MQRRHFLALSAAALLARHAHASDELHVEFSEEIYEQALASGEPFILDFYASW